MNKLLISSLMVISLSGCSTVKSWIPSFWDDNQSSKIIDVRQLIHNIDCDKSQLEQASLIQTDIQWFILYSESKGWRQQDVLKILAPMKETVDDWANRSKQKQGSKTYCELKKKTLKLQADKAATSILGRF